VFTLYALFVAIFCGREAAQLAQQGYQRRIGGRGYLMTQAVKEMLTPLRQIDNIRCKSQRVEA
jgi:hypothetical protein